MKNLDETDTKILQAILVRREQIAQPRVGDYVQFATGQLERISHDWDDAFQTSPGGSFFLFNNGHGSFSGALNPCVKQASMTMLTAELLGSYWFFHHGFAGAGRGVYFEIPCRVYQTSEAYGGFTSDVFKSADYKQRQHELATQLAAVKTQLI